MRFMKRGKKDLEGAELYSQLVRKGFAECDQIKTRLENNRNDAVKIIKQNNWKRKAVDNELLKQISADEDLLAMIKSRTSEQVFNSLNTPGTVHTQIDLHG